jgi:hypothetical protein
LYSSAKAGPNQGWAGSLARGAAITVWGRNLGSSRGSSFVTVAGVPLTNDTDYTEWGATTSPTTAKGFQRITFWLNSSMAVGDTRGITVTVNGVPSNALPFTIDNTGVIRFIDGSKGNDSWDGQYPDNGLGGTHGPWKTPFMYTQRAGTGPGAFFYLRGGTYTAIFDPSSGHPASAYIGYFEQGSGATCATAGNLAPCGCTIYYPTIDGTDALRYTVTSYPGEMATFSDVMVDNKSSYWTFTNFRWIGSAAAGLWANGMGDEWSMCGNCQRHSVGLNMIGMEFGGYMHHAVGTAFGDNFQIVANYFNVHPVAGAGYDNTTAYILYLSAGDNRLVADNELHGGSMYGIHNYDEERCSAPYSVNRRISNLVIDSNWIDMTRDATVPVDIRDGILTGMNLDDTNGNTYANATIRNNVFFSRDSLVSEGGIQLHSENSKNLNGIHIYNNTFAGPFPACVNVFYSSAASYSNVDFTNNICSGVSQYDWDSGGAPHITPTINYNLVAQAPRVNGTATVSNNVIGAPSFVNAPTDFHLQASSPAIHAGIPLAGVTLDYDGNARPSGGPYDLGALEYVSGGTPPPPPASVSVSISPAAASLGGGQSQQFTATVSGTSNTAVTWSLSPQAGTLSNAGLYTAPGTISTQQQVQVTATSAADGTKSAAATITLTPPAPAVSVTVTPATISLSASQTQQFSVTVSGSTNTAVTWSLNPNVGTLSASGLYTAPSSIASQQSIQVTATSAADATKSAASTITLQPAAAVVSISVTPGTASLPAGGTQQFTATVSGTSNTAVTWSMSPNIGTLSASGLYTAPSSISSQQPVQVKATSAADTTKSATAMVTLQPPAPVVSIAVTPGAVSLSAGQAQQFSALVTGSTNTAVTWSMSPSVGTLSSSGLYTAPSSIATQGSVRVTATPVADGTKSASAIVSLTAPPVPAPSSGFSVSWATVGTTQLALLSQNLVRSTRQPGRTQVRVTWTAPAGHSPYDAIWLTGDGSVNWWYAWQGVTGQAASGSFTVSLPTSPGIYQFHYVSASKNQVMAVSADLPVNVAGFKVTATPTTAAANASLTVSWTAPAGRPQTWADTIGLYAVGSANDAPVWSQYTMGATSGTFTLPVPAAAGVYEFRYVTSYVMEARSTPVTVQ